MLILPKSSGLVLVLVLTVAASANIAWTTIDYPGSTSTFVNGINNKGDVVGSYRDGGDLFYHGFLLSGGVFTTIDYPSAYSTSAEGINDAGDIVGTYCPVQVPCEPTGFLLHNGIMTTIRVPGREYTWIHGINNAGDMVGESQLNKGTIGFVLKKGSGFTRIVALGAKATYVKGINNAGDIVGYFYPRGQTSQQRGYLLRDGIWQLMDFPRSRMTEINSVNDNHQIAGAATGVGVQRGFARYNNHILILKHTTDFVWVMGINNEAVMAGYFSDGLRVHGFIRTH